MAELEVKAYRFSISWSRILLGSGEVNQAGLWCDSDIAAAVALALLWPQFALTGRNQLLFGAD